MNDIRNIGIFAHVDAGKTTLTEQLLLYTGAITKAGRVDDGAAHTDRLKVERQRGISVRSSTVAIAYEGTTIRIIDTPGHVDFSNEVENALCAIDGAVLVLSAVEGVQAQTAAIYRVLKALHIPVAAFINKVDRVGVDADRVLNQLQTLAKRPLMIDEDLEVLTERLTEFDDCLLKAALAGPVSQAAVHEAFARGCRSLEALPVCKGSALKGDNIKSVLQMILRYLPPPAIYPCFSAVAYHVEHVGNDRQVHVRVYGGTLVRGETINGHRFRWLRKLTPQGLVNSQQLDAGDIGVVIGANALRSGDVLGERCRGSAAVSEAVLKAQVVPKKETDLPALKSALARMNDEQRELNLTFEPRTRQMHVQVRGEIQRQVIEQTLLMDYGISASLLKPQVLFRETPEKEAVGKLDMFFSPWYARAVFHIRPLPRGGGVQFVSRVNTDLYLKYQRDIEATTYECLREGLHGWPVTDVLVTLTEGECIGITHPGSRFGPVVPLGLFDALQNAGTQLMEPMLRFEAHVDRHGAGTLLYDLTAARAVCEPAVYYAETAVLTGRAPVITTLDFAERVHRLSHGRGLWRTVYDGYELAPDGVGEAIPRTTLDPTHYEAYMAAINGVM